MTGSQFQVRTLQPLFLTVEGMKSSRFVRR